MVEYFIIMRFLMCNHRFNFAFIIF